jgi:hypothetical protein
MIIGNMFLLEEDGFQRRLLKSFFNDEIPRYLMLCLRIDALNEKMSDIVKHTIKLISIYLEVCKFEIEAP